MTRRDGPTSNAGVIGVCHKDFGEGLSLEAPYTEWLSGFATTRCRFLLSDLVADKVYAPKATEGFSFMRTNAAYKRSMEIAYKR